MMNGTGIASGIVCGVCAGALGAMGAEIVSDWSEAGGVWCTQSYWRDENILQRYTFTSNREDKTTGESSVQVHMQVAEERPRDGIELRLTLPEPLDLSRAEAVELQLKVVAGTGLKARNAYFCSPDFKKLAIADWLEDVDVSGPGAWQRVVIDLTNVRVLDKAAPNQAGVYDRHDVTTICLNFVLPAGAVDITLRIDGMRTTTLPPLPARLRVAALKQDRGFWRWRSRYPARDLSPRPDDGRNLALSIRKLSRGLAPERPFLIWGIGPSYLNFLGDGTVLACYLRRRFPNAPPIVYKKQVGSSVPWRYVLGWARQVVVPEQPDLVLLYGIGLESDLEKIFRTLRRHTTADIIVASVHWKSDDVRYWGKDEDATDFADIPEMRRICRAYGVEFVENRKEWAQYLRDHDMKVEVDPEHGLLMDGVHQSKYGALVINENIVRHFAVRDAYAYDPDSRERRLPVTRREVSGDKESATAVGSSWTVGEGVATSGVAGSRIRVRFTGNRIDLIGVRSPDGGTARVLLDGVPADKAPAFFAGPIVRGPDNARPAQGSTADIGPHGITLGRNPVPQVWTIRMTDDAGGYEFFGNVTGADGTGHVLKPFTSDSGQVRVPPELWRHGPGCVPFLHPWNGKILNRKGDTYTFRVTRACTPLVEFRGKTGEFRVNLFQQLPNRVHVLEVVAVGDGKVHVERFDVFEPPLR
ncbi:MAG: hypothetical protein GXP31_16620 [Kiritimatiellaeota bacterium]|nr:hypothetical protein [Kiritimatiellota bacterium]